jgi:hypothetical protein
MNRSSNLVVLLVGVFMIKKKDRFKIVENSLPCKIKLDKKGGYIKAYAYDVSSGGICMHVPHRILTGTIASVVLDMTDFEFNTKVIWSKECHKRGDLFFITGFKFLFLTSFKKQVIKSYIDRFKKREQEQQSEDYLKFDEVTRIVNIK